MNEVKLDLSTTPLHGQYCSYVLVGDNVLRRGIYCAKRESFVNLANGKTTSIFLVEKWQQAMRIIQTITQEEAQYIMKLGFDVEQCEIYHVVGAVLLVAPGLNSHQINRLADIMKNMDLNALHFLLLGADYLIINENLTVQSDEEIQILSSIYEYLKLSGFTKTSL